MATARLESRSIRPYVSMEPLESLFNQVQLWRELHQLAEVTYLSDGEFLAPSYSIKFPFSRAQLAEAVDAVGLVPTDVRLVVFATGRTLKATCIALNKPLSALNGPDGPIDILTIDPRSAPHTYCDYNSGFDLVVAAVVAHDVPPRPLFPSRAGTWLAKRDFAVLPNRTTSTFSPVPMNPEDKEALGLHPATLIYCEVRDTVTTCSAMDDVLTVYVDASVLGLVQQSPSSPASIHFQGMLARSALAAVLHRTAREAREQNQTEQELTSLPACIWNQMTARASAAAGVSPLQAATWLTSDVEHLISVFDACGGLRADVLRSLSEVSP